MYFDVPESQPTLTVGDLRKLIETLPNDTQVTTTLHALPGVSIDWANVRSVNVPDFDETHFLNLHLEDSFDSRQL